MLIYKLLNALMVALHIVGHAAMGVFLTNTRIVGWEVRRYKQLIIVGNLLVWPLLGLIRSVVPGGPQSFLASLFRPGKRGWLPRAAFTFIGARYIAQEVYRRAHPVPASPQVKSTHTRSVDLTQDVFSVEEPSGIFLKLAARGLNQLFTLEVVTHDVALPCLPPEFEGFTIVQLSDFHYGGFTSAEFVRRVVQMAIEMSPDVIALTGDYQTYSKDVEEAAALLAPLGKWSMRERGGKGVLAVLGNHDRFHESSAHVTDALRRAGIRVLNNEHVRFSLGDADLYIAGVADPWSQRADMDLALHGIPEGGCTVLLAHVPDYFVTASKHPVALQLSGHNHGGQIKLPLIGHLVVSSRYNRRYAEGFHTASNSLMYIANGLGGHPPIRWGAKPQIAVLRLRQLGIMNRRVSPQFIIPNS